MKKRTYRLLYILCGGVSGLLTGAVIMFLWMKNIIAPAMFYMKILDQVKFFAWVGQMYGMSEIWMLNVLHYLTALLFGILFALFFHRIVKSLWNGLGLGFLFGIIWWILTPFYLMPFFFVISPNAPWQDLTMYELLDTLISHILFGVILGFFYALFSLWLRRKARNG